MSTLPFSWVCLDRNTNHDLISHRVRESNLADRVFINTLLPVGFYFKYKLPPKSQTYAFKDLWFSFHWGTAVSPCPWTMLLGIVHMYQNTAVPLLSFIFFHIEKPASVSHPISCSLSKDCSGLSSPGKLHSSERVSWKLCLRSFPVSDFSH